MVKKTAKQEEVIENLTKFYSSREEVINFFRDHIEMLADTNYNAKQMKQDKMVQDLKY